jgi:hypothetical protein
VRPDSDSRGVVPVHSCEEKCNARPSRSNVMHARAHAGLGASLKKMAKEEWDNQELPPLQKIFYRCVPSFRVEVFCPVECMWDLAHMCVMLNTNTHTLAGRGRACARTCVWIRVHDDADAISDLYVCVCVRVHIIYTHTYTCIYACIHPYVCAIMNTHRAYVCMYAYVCIYVCEANIITLIPYMYIYIYTYMYMYIYTHTHAHKHTHTCMYAFLHLCYDI